MRNPIKNIKFKEILKFRRNCHQMFDKIKCEYFYTVLDSLKKDQGIDFEHLILREHIFTFEELQNFDFLLSKLKILHSKLNSHFHLHVKGEKCKDVTGC